MNVKKKIASLALAATLTAGGAGAAYAASFGNSLNGASSVEVLQVKYDGAAWNYSGSGYRNAWFKYSRAGKTLMHKVATNYRTYDSASNRCETLAKTGKLVTLK